MKFQKRYYICSWLVINLSTSGISITIGKRGLSLNIGKNGLFLNTSIPRTGLYERTKIELQSNTDIYDESNEKEEFEKKIFWRCL